MGVLRPIALVLALAGALVPAAPAAAQSVVLQPDTLDSREPGAPVGLLGQGVFVPATAASDDTQAGNRRPGTRKPAIRKPGVARPGTKKPGTRRPADHLSGSKRPAATLAGSRKPGLAAAGTRRPGSRRP